LNKGLPLYLDSLRAIAALAVFISHAQGFLLPGMPASIASNGDEAVAVFFVLSGFVIQYVLATKENDWRSYAFARIVRISSVVVVALLATYVADHWGMAINPGLYQGIPFYNDDYAADLLRALTFTSEYWYGHVVFGTNEAYWSLGFEVSYYIAAGVFVFAPRRIAPLLTLVFALLIGPKIVAFSLLWLLGAITYRITSSRFSPRYCLAIFLATPVLYAVAKLSLHDLKHPIFIWQGFASCAESLLYYTVIALIAALNIFSFSRVFQNLDFVPARAANAVRWVAGASFTLYLTNEPLFVLAKAMSLDRSPAYGIAGTLGVLCIAFALAEIGERRKHHYKTLIRYVFRDVARA
jgi:peptidoglycan/LPS O-acetylase OafA/YrhL